MNLQSQQIQPPVYTPGTILYMFLRSHVTYKDVVLAYKNPYKEALYSVISAVSLIMHYTINAVLGAPLLGFPWNVQRV